MPSSHGPGPLGLGEPVPELAAARRTSQLGQAPRADAPAQRIKPLDLWRVHLEQCPECGHTHGGGARANGSRPERHIYDLAASVAEDLLCPLCGEVFQSPLQTPCGHHYCSLCMRTLLQRTAGKVACPLDGQVLTRFALRPAEQSVLERLEDLRIRCPVCGDEIRKAELQLHLQDPVNMVEPPEAYQAILRPFYMSCPLSNFTVGELNGTSSLVRFYRRLGAEALQRFVLTSEDFIVLPDPKMGFQPHTEEDVASLRRHGGYFNAWWVHPGFRTEVWWRHDPEGGGAEAGAGAADSAGSCCGSTSRSPKAAQGHLLGGLDCSAEPWHESSFVHTWSAVQKPTSSRYLCCLRDLRGDDLPVLENFRSSVLAFLRENYAVDEGRVWIYCHYPSSARYSTLHFHIIFSGEESSRFKKFARKLERPHQLSRQFPLEWIIETLRRDPTHFETCTLSYYLGDKADLMDPISAFFSCSPHRYVGDFTFRWDPCAVAPSRAQAIAAASPNHAEATRPDGGEAASQQRTYEAASRSSDCDERIGLQLVELRRTVDGLRQSLDGLGDLVQQIIGRQKLEENGAARLALLQLSAMQVDRPSATSPFHTALWVMVGASLGVFVAMSFGPGRGRSF